jgi:dolichol-phosphate mannosyltransferase
MTNDEFWKHAQNSSFVIRKIRHLLNKLIFAKPKSSYLAFHQEHCSSPKSKVLSDSLVIIPTYNELENIERMLNTVFSLPRAFHVLIVDDGSPDGTGQIVKNLQQTFPGQLHLLERSGKLGLGTAYIAGFKWGLTHGYEYIFEMDADFSHNPQALPLLYEACAQKGADLAVGSRYTRGGKVSNWSWDRIILSYGASLYVRLMTGMPVKDPTAGFICYRRKVLESIDLDNIRFVGYAFQIEMKYAAHLLGFKIAEVPITFVDRVAGVSKMSANIIQEAIVGVFQMRWQKR